MDNSNSLAVLLYNLAHDYGHYVTMQTGAGMTGM